jgi:hypothetical protein
MASAAARVTMPDDLPRAVIAKPRAVCRRTQPRNDHYGRSGAVGMPFAAITDHSLV